MMATGLRIREAELAQLWALRRQGLNDHQVAAATGRSQPGVWKAFARTGGVRPRERTRHPGRLSPGDREEISRGLAAGRSSRQIAAQLGRSPSTVSREVARNGGRRVYRAERAERRAWAQAVRPKQAKLAAQPVLRAVVEDKLEEQWSPQQIAAWLPMAYPHDLGMRVSHETIYLSLFVQSRGALRKELTAQLRTGKPVRRPNIAQPGVGGIPNLVSIRQRPAEVEDRALPGHWEGDLIAGSHNTHIATLVERHSRFVMLVRVASKKTDDVIDALIAKAVDLPAQLRQSLTWDRGNELAGHARFSLATDFQVFFCDPASPWQRGSNENTNGLLRQYFPKGTRLDGYDQHYLDQIALRLNTRPRKTLDWLTPCQALDKVMR